MEDSDMTAPERNEAEARQLKSAMEYVAGKLAQGTKSGGKIYPLNRGDIILLVMLLDREMATASLRCTDPLNLKRLRAIREKLGNLAVDAPQMSREEAQQFRD